eukprot:comp22248_c0_seq1/m.52811 comp22248_c0_seq1/g.52811  ORF comp22248_c0_seq1/g.52811 comp22248_c0_seq1/m.52811 type:complete len:301 (-) comp22248_c0_seq1:1632-2534(-)
MPLHAARPDLRLCSRHHDHHFADSVRPAACSAPAHVHQAQCRCDNGHGRHPGILLGREADRELLSGRQHFCCESAVHPGDRVPACDDLGVQLLPFQHLRCGLRLWIIDCACTAVHQRHHLRIVARDMPGAARNPCGHRVRVVQHRCHIHGAVHELDQLHGRVCLPAQSWAFGWREQSADFRIWIPESAHGALPCWRLFVHDPARACGVYFWRASALCSPAHAIGQPGPVPRRVLCGWLHIHARQCVLQLLSDTAHHGHQSARCTAWDRLHGNHYHGRELSDQWCFAPVHLWLGAAADCDI